MATPTVAELTDLTQPLLATRGWDLEGITINAAGSKSAIRVVVDADQPPTIDEVADVSRDVSAAFDAAEIFGALAYTLEVTTPGVERPLTAARHWRRAQGRLVQVVAAPGVGLPEKVRVGAVAGTEDGVDLVHREGREFTVTHVPFADIERAAVVVEFSAPSAQERQLAGLAPDVAQD